MSKRKSRGVMRRPNPSSGGLVAAGLAALVLGGIGVAYALSKKDEEKPDEAAKKAIEGGIIDAEEASPGRAQLDKYRAPQGSSKAPTGGASGAIRRRILTEVQAHA